MFRNVRLDHLLQPGLGKLGHMVQALELKSPFGGAQVADLDILFAATALAVFGPYVAAWSDEQRRAMRQAIAAVKCLKGWLLSQQPLSVAEVAGNRDPATMALFTALLRWPDRRQALGYVQGFAVLREFSVFCSDRVK